MLIKVTGHHVNVNMSILTRRMKHEKNSILLTGTKVLSVTDRKTKANTEKQTNGRHIKDEKQRKETETAALLNKTDKKLAESQKQKERKRLFLS